MSDIQRRPKTSVYQFRKIIPKPLREALGRSEIKKSLGTKDRRTANIRNHQIAAFVAEFLDEAAKSSDPANLKSLLDDFLKDGFDHWDYSVYQRRLHHTVGHAAVHDDDIEKYADKWFEWLITSTECEVEYIDREPGILIDGLSSRKTERLLAEFIETTGLMTLFARDDSAEPRFRRTALRLVSIHGEEAIQVHAPIVSQSLSDTRSDRTGDGTGLVLSKVLALYLEDVSVRERTEMDWRTAFGRLIEYLGSDRSIDGIGSDDILGFRDTLKLFPKPILPETKKATFREKCEYARKHGLPTISTVTINKNLNAISTVFNWAVRNRYITANPAAGVRVTAKQSAGTERQPFTGSDLRLIFGNSYPEPSRDADYWLPWIAFYTGCRMEEIAQLRGTDVDKVDSIPFFHIRGLVKTKTSIRKVPIHSKLIDLGLLDQFEKLRGRDELLFTRLKTTGKGKYSDGYSKRFSRYKNAVGITDSRKVFHSFRHTFKDRCRESDIPLQVQNALLGHTNSAVGEGYGQGFSVRKLKQWIEKIDFSF